MCGNYYRKVTARRDHLNWCTTSTKIKQVLVNKLTIQHLAFDTVNLNSHINDERKLLLQHEHLQTLHQIYRRSMHRARLKLHQLLLITHMHQTTLPRMHIKSLRTPQQYQKQTRDRLLQNIEEQVRSKNS